MLGLQCSTTTRERKRSRKNKIAAAGIEMSRCFLYSSLRRLWSSFWEGGLAWNYIEFIWAWDGLGWGWGGLQWIMNWVIEGIEQRVHKAYHNKYPRLPPTLAQLDPQPQPPSSPSSCPSYPQLLSSIQSQLQKRIINVQKIKQIGEQLYNRLTQDIATMYDNDKILGAAGKIEEAIVGCEGRFQGLVWQLVANWRAWRDIQGVGEFQGFVNKYYHAYCVAVEKEVIASYSTILHQLQTIKTPPSSTSPLSQPYPYSQTFPTLLALLTKFRSLLTTEYQTLHTTMPSKEEQCRTAVIFLSKLRTLFLEMKDVLCGQGCTLDGIWQFARAERDRLRGRVAGGYRRVRGYGDGVLQLTGEDEVEEKREEEQLPAGQKVISQKLSKPAKKPLYKPTTRIPQNFHYAIHLQILLYLYSLHNLPQTLLTLQHSIHRQTNQILKQLQQPLPNYLQQYQSPFLPVIESVRKDIGRVWEIVGVAGGYGQGQGPRGVFGEPLGEVLMGYAVRLGELGVLWDGVELIVGRYGGLCGRLLWRLTQISTIDKRMQDSKYTQLCLQLHQIHQTLQQIHIHITSTLPHLQPHQTSPLLSKIQDCHNLRLELHRINFSALKKQREKIKKKASTPMEGSRIRQSQQILPHILVEDEPGEEWEGMRETGKEREEGEGEGQGELSRDGMERLADFLEKTTEFFQFQLKNIVGSGFDLAVCQLEKYNNKASEAKIKKLKALLNQILKQSVAFTRLAAQPGIPGQLKKQYQISILNARILHQLLSTFQPSSSSSASPSIIQLCEQTLNFQHQDPQKKIQTFTTSLSQFSQKCKSTHTLHHNNTTSLYSIVYRLVKEFSSVMEILCDIFQEILYVFKQYKQLEGERRGGLALRALDVGSEADLIFVEAIAGFKARIGDQIGQLEKFGNIPKNCRNYLKAIFGKFRNNFNFYLPYEITSLQFLSNFMQISIGFSQNHKKILQQYKSSFQTLPKTRAGLDEIHQMSKQLLQLQKQLQNVQKLSEIGIPIDGKSIQRMRKIVRDEEVREDFLLARLVSGVFQARGKGSGEERNLDAKRQGFYRELAQVYRNHYY